MIQKFETKKFIIEVLLLGLYANLMIAVFETLTPQTKAYDNNQIMGLYNSNLLFMISLCLLLLYFVYRFIPDAPYVESIKLFCALLHELILFVALMLDMIMKGFIPKPILGFIFIHESWLLHFLSSMLWIFIIFYDNFDYIDNTTTPILTTENYVI